jgi:hypothetical protein
MFFVSVVSVCVLCYTAYAREVELGSKLVPTLEDVLRKKCEETVQQYSIFRQGSINFFYLLYE